MGQELCNGCQDCTNFKGFEGDFSYFGNKPLTHLNNPTYENTNADNSIFNIKTEYPSDNSVILNNNTKINSKKNEAKRNFSFSSKQGSNDLNFNPLINISSKQTDEIKDNSNNNIFENNINNNSDNNYLDEEDKKRLDEIFKSNKVKKITNLFRKLMEKKSISHQTLCTEEEAINDYQNIQNNLRTDLTVNLIPEKNYIYIGTKFNNKKDGLGLELFQNTNAKFFGRFINDRRVSIGRFIINNENESYYYFGYVKGIHAEGFGWHENAIKEIYYEGMWSNSRKEGIGIERNNKDNSEYRGCFKNGKKNGIGYYYWSDNSNYLGEWSDDNLDGYGIYNFQDGSIYKGHWKQNKMDGLGEFTFPEIKSYFGFFEKDKRAGFGIMIWYKESKIFIGYWDDNKQHGPGKIINNGKIKYGIWENGKYKEKIKIKEDFINILQKENSDYLDYFVIDDYNEILQKILGILNV